MAYPLAVGDIVEFRLIGRLHGQETVNVWHYRMTKAYVDGAATLNLLIGQFRGQVWNGALKPALSDEFTCTGIQAQRVYPTRNVPLLQTVNETGVGGAQSQPSGVAMVVRRLTDLAGRAYRGRIYLPGLPAGAELDSQLAPAYVATHQANLELTVTLGLNIAPDVGIALPVIWSAAVPARRTDVTRGVLDVILRYQRRREVGRGS